MKYLITRKVKRITKDFNNKKLQITIPKNQMIEIAYKTFAGADRQKQIVGAYVYLKMGEDVFPSIVEFSRDEVEIIGDVIGKKELAKEAILRGKIFFTNKEICTCAEFIKFLEYAPVEEFTIVNDDNNLLKVMYGNRKSVVGRQVLRVIF